MDLVPYALVSLDDFKSYMGFSNAKNDEWAKLAINMATDFIEQYCGRRFKQTTYTDEVYDGSGRRELQLKQFPIISFTKLQKNRATDNSDDWEDIDSNKYWVDKDSGIITMTNSFLDFRDDEDYVGMSNPINANGMVGSTLFELGKSKYRATYSAGYATRVPFDIQYACMAFANELWNDRQSSGLTMEQLGDHRVQFAKAFGSTPMLKQTLDKYKDINI